MAPGFAFPPPPPPPPRTTQSRQDFVPQTAAGRGGYDSSSRGRGGSHVSSGVRGKQYIPAGSYVNPNFRPQIQRDTRSHQQHQGNQPDRTYAGHKRKLDALREPRQQLSSKPAPETAPAVPSFGALFIPVVQTPKQPPQASQAKPAAKSLFGAGVRQDEPVYSDSDEAEDDDDVDEEAMYAQLGTKLVFEYEGQVMTLSNEAELAQWQEERRKRFPTSNRVAEKEAQRRIVGEERKRLLDAAYALTRPRWTRHMNNHNRQPNDAESMEAHTPAATKDVPATAKPLLGLSTYDSEDEDEETAPGSTDLATTTDRAEPVKDEVDSDDEPPETMSSKTVETMVLNENRPACRYFFNTGRCDAGNTCQFRHDSEAGMPPAGSLDARKKRAKAVTRANRSQKKGIHQLLLDQENAAADALALKVIKHLGDIGFFKEQA